MTVYLGESIDPFILSLRDSLKKDNTFYNFEYDETILDARFIGNRSRFINHGGGKKANLKVRIVKSQSRRWVAFYSLRDINPSEELFFDYDGDGQLAELHGDLYPFILPK